MGSPFSKEDRNWRRYESKIEDMKEEHENDKQTHQEEMRQKEIDLEKKNQEIALLEKVNRKRRKVIKRTPGDSGTYSKETHFPNRLLISLYGEPGTGKTSLINSLKYAIDGGLKDTERIQAAHEEYHGTFTMESLEVVLTDHLSVIDNRGINSEKADNSAIQEDVIRQMEGTYKRGAITWQTIAAAEGKEADKTSYCSVVVFSAHNANVVRQYRNFIHRLRDWQGQFPLAVITHVDEVPSKDVRLALKSGGIGDIYEVVNVTSGENGKDTLTTKHQRELLKLLEKCFSDGDMIFLRRQELGSGE